MHQLKLHNSARWPWQRASGNPPKLHCAPKSLDHTLFGLYLEGVFWVENKKKPNSHNIPFHQKKKSLIPSRFSSSQISDIATENSSGFIGGFLRASDYILIISQWGSSQDYWPTNSKFFMKNIWDLETAQHSNYLLRWPHTGSKVSRTLDYKNWDPFIYFEMCCIWNLELVDCSGPHEYFHVSNLSRW